MSCSGVGRTSCVVKVVGVVDGAMEPGGMQRRGRMGWEQNVLASGTWRLAPGVVQQGWLGWLGWPRLAGSWEVTELAEWV